MKCHDYDRRVPPVSVNVTTRRTPCADDAVAAPCTSRSMSALLAATRPPRLASTTGARRPSEERLLAPAAAATSRTSLADSRTASEPALPRALVALPPSRSKPKQPVNHCPNQTTHGTIFSRLDETNVETLRKRLQRHLGGLS